MLYGLGMFEDITERKRTEEALRASQTNLAEAQRIAHLGSWNWHIADNTLDWSDELYRIFDLDPEATPITCPRLRSRGRRATSIVFAGDGDR